MAGSYYSIMLLVVLVVFTSTLTESTPLTTIRKQQTKENNRHGQQEMAQRSNGNGYFQKPGGSFFFTNVGPNSFEYRGMFEPGKSSVDFKKEFSSFFKDLPDFPKLPSFEEFFNNVPPSSTTTSAPNTTPSLFKFKSPFATNRPRSLTKIKSRLISKGPRVITNIKSPNISRFITNIKTSKVKNNSSSVRNGNNNSILKGSKPEYDTKSLTIPNKEGRTFRNPTQRTSKSNFQENQGFRKDFQRKGPQSPYIPPEEPIYDIPRRKTITSPPKSLSFGSFKSKDPKQAGHKPNTILRRQGFLPPSEGEGYFPRYDIFKGKTRIKEYPQIFSFNDERINIVEFDRDKKNGRIRGLNKADVLDPDNVPRNKFLILHGGVYNEDGPSQINLNVNHDSFRSVQRDFYDIFTDDEKFEKHGFLLKNI